MSIIVVSLHGAGIPGPNVIGSYAGGKESGSQTQKSPIVMAGNAVKILPIHETVIFETIPSSVIWPDNTGRKYFEVKGGSGDSLRKVMNALRPIGLPIYGHTCLVIDG